MTAPIRPTLLRSVAKRALVVWGLFLAFLGLALWGPVQGQQVHRNGFESKNTSWTKGPADAPCKELAHDMSDQTAHNGQLSEHIQLNAEVGSYINYFYPVGQAPIGEELNISLYVKANRPGVQIIARVVLPRERNGGKLDEPLTCLIRGDTYQMVGRWERLELRGPVKLLGQQQQLLRAELNRDVDIADAYVDRLVLNVYGGPGMTEVWLDDLEVGPVRESDAGGKPKTDSVPNGTPGSPSSPSSPTPGRSGVVQLEPAYLSVSGKPFLIRGIRHTDTPLKVLRQAGFNTIWLPSTTPDAVLEEAVNLGFWLVPGLPVDTNGNPSPASQQLNRDVARFLATDAVLCWDLGGARTLEEAPLVARAATAIKAIDPHRPIATDVWDGFPPYARQQDMMIGAHRWPLMTSLELMNYREWLNQRRQLAQPNSVYQWTWVQTHLPDWYLSLVYDRKKDAGGQPATGNVNEPIGPMPEQIRLLTYISLAAGCQGLGFWSDRFLADSHQGRDRLLGLALLNQELQMLEPMLLSVVDQPVWIDSSNKEVKAVVFRTKRGILVLPMWLGKGAQYVPGQSAGAKISMTVPQVPNGTQAWEVTPGDVSALQTERVVEGTKVTLPEFGLTTAIVFTADNGLTGLLTRLQDHARRTRRLAAQWANELAQAEMEKVSQVEAELERAGHTLPDGAALMEKAQQRLKASTDYWNNRDYREAYHEAQRALRPLRILMRAQWEKATLAMDVPSASPYALSFFTLPRHWELAQQIQQSEPGANLLPSGDFEEAPHRPPFAWLPQETSIDEMELRVWRVGKELGATTDGHFKEKITGPAQKPLPNSMPTLPGQTSAPNTSTLPKDPNKLTDKEKKKADKDKALMERALEPKEGQRCLKLQIKPKPGAMPKAALERTFLGVNSPAIHLQPGTLVRITVWMRLFHPISLSADGAMFYDNAGGEPLAIRVTESMPWKRFTLYRRVPASGTISVTCALTGIGTVYFDDVRIEVLTPGRASVTAPQWRR